MAAPINPERGEDRHCSLLSDEDIKNIRKIVRWREEMKEQLRHVTNRKLGEKFGVSEFTIFKIATYRTWRHVIEGEESNE